MTRCWFNTAVRSCKTCSHFNEDYGHGPSCSRGLDVNIPTGRPGRFALPVNCPSWDLDDSAVAS
jgi:hypothetical protein